MYGVCVDLWCEVWSLVRLVVLQAVLVVWWRLVVVFGWCWVLGCRVLRLASYCDACMFSHGIMGDVPTGPANRTLPQRYAGRGPTDARGVRLGKPNCACTIPQRYAGRGPTDARGVRVEGDLRLIAVLLGASSPWPLSSASSCCCGS